MRITGGKARSIPLRAPKGDFVRPATDALRQAVFSSIGPIDGCVVLDLFAGSGAYGLEALSRGAATAHFVEQHAGARRCIEANLQAVLKSAGIESSAGKIDAQEVMSWLNRDTRSWDIIIADPPYDWLRDQGERLLDLLPERLNPGGTLILEAPGDYQPPPLTRLSAPHQSKAKPHQPCFWRWQKQAD